MFLNVLYMVLNVQGFTGLGRHHPFVPPMTIDWI